MKVVKVIKVGVSSQPQGPPLQSHEIHRNVKVTPQVSTNLTTLTTFTTVTVLKFQINERIKVVKVVKAVKVVKVVKVVGFAKPKGPPLAFHEIHRNVRGDP